MQIVHRYTRAVLYEDSAETIAESLVAAVKRGADLGGADLRGANLGGAELGGVTGIEPDRVADLRMLLDQPGRIRAYKLVNADGQGPFNGGLEYAVGESLSVDDADTDESVECGAGINVATLPWCITNWSDGYRVLIVEFEAKDIACIPTATDGKFRLHRCTVVAEKDVSHLTVGSDERREREAV